MVCSREISYHSCLRTSNPPGTRNVKPIPEIEISAIKLPNEESISPVGEASPLEAPSNIREKLSKTFSRSLFGRSKSTIESRSPESEDLSAELHSLRQKISRSKSFHRFPTSETPVIRGFKHASVSLVDSSYNKPSAPIPKRDQGISRLFWLHSRFLGRHKKHVTFVTKPTIIPPSPYYLDWDDLNDLSPTSPDVLNEEIYDPSSQSPEELEREIDGPSSPSSDGLPVEMELEVETNVCNTLV